MQRALSRSCGSRVRRRNVNALCEIFSFFACALLGAAQISAVVAADSANNPFADREHAAVSRAAVRQDQRRAFTPAMEPGMREHLQGSGSDREQCRESRHSKTPSSRWSTPVVCSIASKQHLLQPQCLPTRIRPCRRSRRRWRRNSPRIGTQFVLNPQAVSPGCRKLYDQSGQTRARSGIKYLLERYYKDFVHAGAQTVRRRQGKAQSDERRARDPADAHSSRMC